MSVGGPVLGCIADDFTGAVDVAAGVSLTGLTTVIVTADEQGDVGELGELAGSADAVVIALKSRTNPAAEALEQSLRAADLLLEIGARTLYFKYCSTFDSTPRGNIGPVADALLELVGAPLAVVVPGYPANRRSVRNGQLYVGELLLADSAMRDHPLTPMTSSDVPAMLSEQSRHRVGRLSLATVRLGASAIGAALDDLVVAGDRYAVVDTVGTGDVRAVAEAVRSHRLVTGGAALAHELARRVATSEGTSRSTDDPPTGGVGIGPGRRIVLSGSCSSISQLQVADFAHRRPILQLDPRDLGDPARSAERALSWAQDFDGPDPVLVSTTVGAPELRAIQLELGRDEAAARVEAFFAAVGSQLFGRGFNQILVGGGETSGRVTAALGVREMVVGAPISPGLAWCTSQVPPLVLALKSGNFGSPDVFTRAFDVALTTP